jgi:hypothetical protein
MALKVFVELFLTTLVLFIFAKKVLWPLGRLLMWRLMGKNRRQLEIEALKEQLKQEDVEEETFQLRKELDLRRAQRGARLDEEVRNIMGQFDTPEEDQRQKLKN